jgi:hypothetical protein
LTNQIKPRYFRNSSSRNRARPRNRGGFSIRIVTLTKHKDKSPIAAAPQGDGAPEITAEMVEAGLEWLYAYNSDTDGRATVEAIIRSALASRTPPLAEAGSHQRIRACR